MEVAALPACLWPEGSEIMRASFTVFTERQVWSVCCLSVCRVNTPADLRIQHVNVIFAFQRYLHGYVSLSLRLLGKEARSETAANTDRQI